MIKAVQAKAILILLDCEGHAEWELAKYLDVSEGYLNPLLEELMNLKVVYQGPRRPSKRKPVIGEHLKPAGERKGYCKIPKKRTGRYQEIPYYITSDLDAFRFLIREINSFQKTSNPRVLAGFILKGIFESEYAEELIEKFGKEAFIKAAKDELGKCYDYFIEKFFKLELKVIFYRDTVNGNEMPLLSEFHGAHISEMPETDHELWYLNYMRNTQPDELQYLMSPFAVVRSKREVLKDYWKI